MKKLNKILIAVVLAVASIVMTVALAACGGGEAQLTGMYNSNKQISYMNFAPQYNYRIMTIKNQIIETYADDTYCLTVSSVTYSNVTFGENIPTADFTANEKDTVTTKYYGKLTVNEATEEDATYVLGKPTRVVNSTKEKSYIDTANWSDAMAETTRPIDPQTGEKGDALDKDAYLEQQLKGWADGDIEVYVMFGTAAFEYIKGV